LGLVQEKWPFCVFLGDLGATYDDHLRLIGKRVLDFLLVLIELFSLRITAEALRAIICSKSAILLQWGLVDPKFQVEGVAPTNHSPCQKTRLNNLSYGIKNETYVSSVLSQSTHLTDGQTEFSSLDRICIPCSAVLKMSESFKFVFNLLKMHATYMQYIAFLA